MGAKLEDLALMPNWPAMLSDVQAALYVGLSREGFRQAVDEGLYPQPVRRFGRRVLWWRPAIDHAAAYLAGHRPEGRSQLPPISDEKYKTWTPL